MQSLLLSFQWFVVKVLPHCHYYYYYHHHHHDYCCCYYYYYYYDYHDYFYYQWPYWYCLSCMLQIVLLQLPNCY